jgi:hypothetical protein
VKEQVSKHDEVDKQADSLERGKLRKLKKVTAGMSIKAHNLPPAELTVSGSCVSP